MNNEILRTARVLKKLPHAFGRNGRLPNGLEGATICRLGTLQNDSLVEGGGLVIDFQPAGTNETHRVVFAFNDEAIWVEGQFDQIP